MQIEVTRALMDQTLLPPSAEAELRARARVRAANYSPFIEENASLWKRHGALSPDERARSRAVYRQNIGNTSAAYRLCIREGENMNDSGKMDVKVHMRTA